MTYVIEIFVPVVTNARFEATVRALRSELTNRFGGATLYSRAPAQGEWKDAKGASERDDLVILEVMADELDQRFWSGLRERLEAELDQDEILIRAQTCVRL